MQKADKKQT